MLEIGRLKSEVRIRHCLEMAGWFPRRTYFWTLPRRCFWHLGYEVNFLGTLEVRQMVTSVIAQFGFRRGRACF